MKYILAKPCSLCKKDIELDEFLQHHTIKVDVYTNHTQTLVLCNSCFEPFREGGLLASKKQEAIR